MAIQVTMGICTRNNAETIGEAIASILKQDFSHNLMEIVVVDGNSQDKTLSIVSESLKDADISSRFFSENKGLGYARQLVVNNAKGKYIVWVDGDMIVPQNFVGHLFDFMEEHPEAGIVKGKQALVPGGNLLATLEVYSRIAGKMVDYTGKKAHSKVLGTSGCIYRTGAIRQGGGFDENLRGYCEDWDAEIKVRAIGWSLSRVDVNYHDYERNSLTWKSLWKRYWLRGYYTHYFLHNYPGLIKHFKMFPPASFVAGFLNARKLFRLTGKKVVFLLPIQHFFKFTAWYVGFLRSHEARYEPHLL